MKVPTAVILAAGLGRRMKSKTIKVLHPVAGRPMITYPVERLRELSIQRIIVVVGPQSERVKEVLSPYGVEITEQSEPLGTADAVMRVRDSFGPFSGSVLIINGDTPLITKSTLQLLLSMHHDQGAVLTLVTASVDNPDGYGRVVRSPSGQIRRVVEQRDAKPAVLAISEINAGFYVVEADFLFDALQLVKNKNDQGEFYLTEIIELAVKRKKKVASLKIQNSYEEILGINSRLELAHAEKRMRQRILQRHLARGVTLLDPDSTWIDAEVVLGQDTVIYPHVQFEGKCQVGEDCVIRSYCRIADSRMGSGVQILESCVINQSILEDHSMVGPFAHLRPGTIIRKGAKVGNFVETKKHR